MPRTPTPTASAGTPRVGSRRPGAADRAYAHIKQAVLTGRLDGELVSEGTFADELQVSRTPVREAFLRLQAEGLMRLYPKRGALVLPIAPREAREVLDARLLLEGDALDRVASGAPRDAVVAELDDIVQRQRTTTDPAAFADLDAAFHTRLVTAGGNSLIDGFYASLGDRQRRMVARAVTARADIRTLTEEHAAIVTALAQGDAEAARAHLAAHLHDTYEGML